MGRRRRLCWGLSVAALVVSAASASVVAQNASARAVVLREALDIRRTVVAVEVSLVDDRLEAKIAARLPGVKKGRLQNIVFVGRGVGRRPPKTRTELFEPFEEDEPYPTRRSGMIDFSGKKERTAQGTVVREEVAFELPESLRRDGRYELWVDVEELQSGGKPWRFKFDLDALYDTWESRQAFE